MNQYRKFCEEFDIEEPWPFRHKNSEFTTPLDNAAQLALIFGAYRSLKVAVGTIKNEFSAIRHVREKRGDHEPLIPKNIRVMFMKGLEWLQTPEDRSSNPMLPDKAIKFNSWLNSQMQISPCTRAAVKLANILGCLYGLRGGEYLVTARWHDPIKKLSWSNLSLDKWKKALVASNSRLPMSWYQVIKDISNAKDGSIKLFLTKHWRGRAVVLIPLVKLHKSMRVLCVFEALLKCATSYQVTWIKFAWTLPLLINTPKNSQESFSFLKVSDFNSVTKLACEHFGWPIFKTHDRRRGMATAANCAKKYSPGIFADGEISVVLRHTVSCTRRYISDTVMNRKLFIRALATFCIEKLPFEK